MYRNPRTTQEHRANESCPYTRAKRRNIPTSWDDLHTRQQKSWKKKRKKQYRPNPRGQRHQLFLDISYKEWKVKEFLETQNIPFSLDDITESGYNNTRAYKRVVVRTIPDYHYFWKRIDGVLKRLKGHQIGFKAIYEWKPCGYTTYSYSRLIGYKLVWWSDKDIGMVYILNKHMGQH